MLDHSPPCKIYPAFVLGILFLLVQYQVVSADIGPSGPAGGSGINPGVSTQVRMESERVEISIQPAAREDGTDGSFALVTALFSMRNLGATTEAMRVKFPLNSGPVAALSGDELRGFRAWVGEEQAVVTYGQELFYLAPGYQVNTSWAYFDAVFPPGALLPIRVSYMMVPLMAADGEQSYSYTLITGRDWQGTIGSAEIIVELPYEVNLENVIRMPAGSRLTGKHITWRKEDFEPADADNFSVSIVPPVQWLAVSGIQAALPVIPDEGWTNLLVAQMCVEDQPRSAGCWLALAEAYWNLAVLPGYGFGQSGPAFSNTFAELGVEAYRMSAQLNPQQRAPYIGIAGLLLLKANGELQAHEQDAILAALHEAALLPSSNDLYLAGIENQRLVEIYQALGERQPAGTLLPKTGLPAASQPAGTETPSPTQARAATPTGSISSSPAPTIAAFQGTVVSPDGPPSKDQEGWANWTLGFGLLIAILVAAIGYRAVGSSRS